MRRRLFNFAAAVSLVLCLATLVLWVRSYHVADAVSWQARDSEAAISGGNELSSCSLATNSGRVYVGFEEQDAPGGMEHRTRGWYHVTFGSVPDLKSRFGFGAGTERFLTVTEHYFFAPFWAVFLGLAIAPTAWVMKLRRTASPVGCRVCGYNLTGNTSGICPECGTSIADEPGAKA